MKDHSAIRPGALDPLTEPSGPPPPPESAGLVFKWLEQLRLTLLGRGLRYAALWTSDLLFRLTTGASPHRFSHIMPGLHIGGQ
jgi:hypothetical protein